MASTAPQRLHDFLQRELPRFRAQWGDETTFVARRAWQATMANEGWVGTHWPTQYGGRSLDITERLECDQVLAEVEAPPIAGWLGVHNVGPTIIAEGDPHHHEHLRRILTGEEIWCQGFSEPEAGSDLASLRCRADLDGDQFVVTGQKIWSSSGLEATHCQLLVRTQSSPDRQDGISVLLVPLDVRGVERRPIRQMTGESEFAELFFDEARFPRSCLLGPLNDGWRVTMTTLSHERAGVIAMAAELERQTLRALGETRTTDPLEHDALVRRYIDGRTLGLLGRRSLATLAEGGRPGPEHAVLKLAWSLANQRLGETRMRLAGQAGTTNRMPEVTHAFLRSRASTIAAGTTEIMKTVLAERVLGLPRH